MTVFVWKRSEGLTGRYWLHYSQATDNCFGWYSWEYFEKDGTLIRTCRPVIVEKWCPYPYHVGQEEMEIDRTICTEADGRTDEDSDESYTVVEALESVDVPAGHFEGCYRIRERWTALDYPEENWTVDLGWFCPGVGWVKWVNLDAGIEENKESRELIEYRVQ